MRRAFVYLTIKPKLNSFQHIVKTRKLKHSSSPTSSMDLMEFVTCVCLSFMTFNQYSNIVVIL